MSELKCGDKIVTTGRNGRPTLYADLPAGMIGTIIWKTIDFVKIQWNNEGTDYTYVLVPGRFAKIAKPNDWENDLELL